MKRFISTLFFFCLAWSMNAQSQEEDHLILKWDLISGNKLMMLTETNYEYNFDVDWDNDGEFDQFGITESVTHQYNSSGLKTIRIRGDFPYLYTNGKVKEVIQWGNMKWKSMYGSFKFCKDLVFSAIDLPDLSEVENMDNMFYKTENVSGNMNLWDVSNVTSMNYMFNEALLFNEDISQWNVSNVKSMEMMFSGATSFNGDLSNWNVGNVTNMYSMFTNAEVFDADLSSWDVSKVTSMWAMFSGAVAFNGDVSNWNVSAAKNLGDMFKGVSIDEEIYNQILINWSSLVLKQFVSFDAGNTYYSSAEAEYAREYIIAVRNWEIKDLGGTVNTEEIENNDFKIFPNPSNGPITIDLNNFREAVQSIEIRDTKGAVVYHCTTPEVFSIQVNLASGIYITKVNTIHSSYTRKTLIQ